jgi:hypothetical protein
LTDRARSVAHVSAEQGGGGALEIEHVEQVAVGGDAARSRPGEAYAKRVLPCQAARVTKLSCVAYERTCCSVAGGMCVSSANGWLTPEFREMCGVAHARGAALQAGGIVFTGVQDEGLIEPAGQGGQPPYYAKIQRHAGGQGFESPELR